MNTQWKRTCIKTSKIGKYGVWRIGFSHGFVSERALVAMVPHTCNRKKKPEILEATLIIIFATKERGYDEVSTRDLTVTCR
jgi:hypothetical protein